MDAIFVLAAAQLCLTLIVVAAMLYVARQNRQSRQEQHGTREDVRLVRAGIGFLLDAQETVARMILHRCREAPPVEFTVERIPWDATATIPLQADRSQSSASSASGSGSIGGGGGSSYSENRSGLPASRAPRTQPAR